MTIAGLFSGGGERPWYLNQYFKLLQMCRMNYFLHARLAKLLILLFFFFRISYLPLIHSHITKMCDCITCGELLAFSLCVSLILVEKSKMASASLSFFCWKQEKEMISCDAVSLQCPSCGAFCLWVSPNLGKEFEAKQQAVWRRGMQEKLCCTDSFHELSHCIQPTLPNIVSVFTL